MHVKGEDMEPQGAAGGAQFQPQYCCVLHVTDTSYYACTREHAYTNALSLVAYAVHVETKAAQKTRRKKRQKPSEHGA
jgi:hypothetical protein